MKRLAKNQYQCEPGETVTFNFEFDKTNFLITGAFIEPKPQKPANIKEGNPLTFTVDKFTVLQIDYVFNGPSGGVYRNNVKGSAGGGTFKETITQPSEDSVKHIPLRGFYTFNPKAA
jgi:hypothetical protein